MIARGQAHGGVGDEDLFHARDSDLDIRLRLLALYSKKNPEDAHVQQTIGNRVNAKYNKDSSPTIPELKKACTDRDRIVCEERRRHKRAREGQMASHYDVPIAAMAAFGGNISRTSSSSVREDDSRANVSFEGMNVELSSS